ncbi:MAG: Spy/CpxP family protein refolding chaperone [Candidatus Aminicenantes bacterium]|jgi:Spy/CpxP family protein refolding chaperone
MKKYIIWTALTLFLSMILFPSVALGQVSDGQEEDVKVRRARAQRDFLGLTPEQQAKLEEHMKSAREKQKAHFESMRKLQFEMRELMQDPEADEKEILKLYEQMSKLRADRFKDSLQSRKEFRTILTPEQLEKLDSFRQRIGQRKNLMRGRFRGERGFARHGHFSRIGRMSFGRKGGARFMGRRFMFRRWWW